jgi:hypothetical protein
MSAFAPAHAPANALQRTCGWFLEEPNVMEVDATPAMQESKPFMKKVQAVHRYYPCEKSSRHRTALLFEKGVRDVTLGINFPSMFEWTLSYTDWQKCDHIECYPTVLINERNSVDMEQQKEVEAEKVKNSQLRLTHKQILRERRAAYEMKQLEKKMARIRVREEKEEVRAKSIAEREQYRAKRLALKEEARAKKMALKESERVRKFAQKEMEKMEKQMSKLNLKEGVREEWMQAKEDWMVATTEKYLAKLAKISKP